MTGAPFPLLAVTRVGVRRSIPSSTVSGSEDETVPLPPVHEPHLRRDREVV